MNKMAMNFYEKTAVGATGHMKPADGQSLGDFQHVVSAAEKLEAQGLITLTSVHRESYTGNRFTDHLMFRRLK